MRPEFPLPDISWEPVAPFWAAAARHELALPRCDGCGAFAWYPKDRCRSCGGTAFTWTPVSGRGRLFSWTVVRHAFLPQFADLVPFVPGLVTIDEDPAVRLVTRIVDCEPAHLRADQPVEVVFRELTFAGVRGAVTAPLFRPLR